MQYIGLVPSLDFIKMSNRDLSINHWNLFIMYISKNRKVLVGEVSFSKTKTISLDQKLISYWVSNLFYLKYLIENIPFTSLTHYISLDRCVRIFNNATNRNSADGEQVSLLDPNQKIIAPTKGYTKIMHFFVHTGIRCYSEADIQDGLILDDELMKIILEEMKEFLCAKAYMYKDPELNNFPTLW